MNNTSLNKKTFIKQYPYVFLDEKTVCNKPHQPATLSKSICPSSTAKRSVTLENRQRAALNVRSCWILWNSLVGVREFTSFFWHQGSNRSKFWGNLWRFGSFISSFFLVCTNFYMALFPMTRSANPVTLASSPSDDQRADAHEAQEVAGGLRLPGWRVVRPRSSQSL